MDSRYIWHPIPDAVDALPPADDGTLRHDRLHWLAEYPDADADGLPDGAAVLVIVSGVNVPESFAQLPGVTLLPPMNLAALVADIDAATVAAVVEALAGHGVPFPAIDGTASAGELLDRIVGYFQVDPRPVTSRFNGREAEFA